VASKTTASVWVKWTGAHEGYGFKSEASRGEHDLLLNIHRTNHQVLAMDIQSHKTCGRRTCCFCEHFILLYLRTTQTIRVDEARHSGLWKITHQYELDHCGPSEVSGIRAGAASKETGSQVPCNTTVSPD
jgi:hypothetical protein